MKRLLSGIQPTGELHIGNYLGAVKQWVELQNEYDTFIMLADYHTLTARPEPKALHKQTLDLLAMLLALGIDPKRSTVFIQSQISAHTELAWIMNNFTSLGQLNRMTQFKEKSDTHGQTVGLFTYPVLQTADIALYGAQAVPVGEDQVQHLELSREIVRSINNFVGKDILVEPKPLLNTSSRIMALNNPTKKMSKSIAGSAIGLLASETEITQTIKRAVTDSDPNSSELSGGVKNLFLILEGIGSPETVKKMEAMRQEGKLRYSELKEQLIEDLIAFLKPVQKTYQSIRSDERVLLKVAEAGRAKAEPIASETLKRTKEALGLVA